MNIVVTGASSGIGKALCELLCTLKPNVNVLGIARNELVLKELKSRYDGKFNYLVVDLSKLDSVYEVVDVVKNSLGYVDVLVNNAGFGIYKDVLSHDVKEVIDLVNVNFITPILLTKELIRFMREGATVVNVITAGIYVLMCKLPIYGASKIALYYATEVLRRELRRKSINVISVYPGIIKTEFHRRAGTDNVRGGIGADEVAKAIVKAIEKREKEVYIPRYLKILKLLGPKLIPIS